MIKGLFRFLFLIIVLIMGLLMAVGIFFKIQKDNEFDLDDYLKSSNEIDIPLGENEGPVMPLMNGGDFIPTGVYDGEWL